MTVTIFISCLPKKMVTVTILWMLLGIPLKAQDEWPQWRGVDRDGSVSTRARSSDWPAQLVVLWEREVGAGYSGPLISGQCVWVHSREDDQEVVSNLTLSEGRRLWSDRYDAPFVQDPSARIHGLGPYSTPCLASGRLFTLGVTTILSAWDAESGRLLWRRDYSEEFDPSFAYYGTAASPLVWENLCFVHFGGHHRDGTHETDRGAMIALKVSDGSEVWRWAEDAPSQGGSSLIGEIDGRQQLVVKAKQMIAGLDARTGEELWRIPYKVTMDNTLGTPLVIGNLVMTSDPYKGVSAWHVHSRDDSWTVKQAWSNRRVYTATSSPVIVAGQLVGFGYTRKGELFGLDSSSGELLWRGEPRWGEHASLISWGDELLVFREDGTLVLVKVSRQGYEIIRQYRVGQSLMWSHPAIARGRILVRHGNRLTAFGLEKE